MRATDLLNTLGRPIAYYPKLAKVFGGITASILFGQLFYWSDKTDNELGVYKTSQDIEDETGLTYREQQTARKKLVDLGVLIETNKRLEHKIYFKINLDRVDTLLYLANEQMCSPRNDKSAVRGETKAQSENDEKRISLDQEITTEITTEITPLLGDKDKIKKSRQLPSNFSPTQKHTELAEKLGINLSNEFEQFRDYHAAKGTVFKDWGAALNTWLRNAKNFQKQNIFETRSERNFRILSEL